MDKNKLKRKYVGMEEQPTKKSRTEVEDCTAILELISGENTNKNFNRTSFTYEGICNFIKRKINKEDHFQKIFELKPTAEELLPVTSRNNKIQYPAWNSRGIVRIQFIKGNEKICDIENKYQLPNILPDIYSIQFQAHSKENENKIIIDICLHKKKLFSISCTVESSLNSAFNEFEGINAEIGESIGAEIAEDEIIEGVDDEIVEGIEDEIVEGIEDEIVEGGDDEIQGADDYDSIIYEDDHYQPCEPDNQSENDSNTRNYTTEHPTGEEIEGVVQENYVSLEQPAEILDELKENEPDSALTEEQQEENNKQEQGEGVVDVEPEGSLELSENVLEVNEHAEELKMEELEQENEALLEQSEEEEILEEEEAILEEEAYVEDQELLYDDEQQEEEPFERQELVYEENEEGDGNYSMEDAVSEEIVAAEAESTECTPEEQNQKLCDPPNDEETVKTEGEEAEGKHFKEELLFSSEIQRDDSIQPLHEFNTWNLPIKNTSPVQVSPEKRQNVEIKDEEEEEEDDLIIINPPPHSERRFASHKLAPMKSELYQQQKQFLKHPKTKVTVTNDEKLAKTVYLIDDEEEEDVVDEENAEENEVDSILASEDPSLLSTDLSINDQEREELLSAFMEPVDPPPTEIPTIPGLQPSTITTKDKPRSSVIDLDDYDSDDCQIVDSKHPDPSGTTAEVNSKDVPGLNDGNEVIFTPYVPCIPIHCEHPAKIVESTTLRGAKLPPLDYQETLPQPCTKKGNQSTLSAIQLETVRFVGQRHLSFLPNGERAGYFICDGTGVGKGRQVAAIIADNYQKGRLKSIWMTASNSLIRDSQRDLTDIGLNIPLFALPASVSEDIRQESGVLFVTYSMLIGKGNRRSTKTRYQQVLDWLVAKKPRDQFSGVIIFDEAHFAKTMNFAKSKDSEKLSTSSSITAKLVNQLQKDLPLARIVYVSATGASDPKHMAYMTRLGLWGGGTSFANFKSFVTSIGESVAAMEMVAMEMKSLGMYCSRHLSYDGAEFVCQTLYLTPAQTKMYNQATGWWQRLIVDYEKGYNCHKYFGKGCKDLRNEQARKLCNSIFWSTHQRFFLNLCIAIKVNETISIVKDDLQSDNSCVIGLFTTGEAALDETLASAKLHDELLSAPKIFVETFLLKWFPMYARSSGIIEDDDDELDADYKPKAKKVAEDDICVVPEQKRLLDRYLAELKQIELPDNPIDQLIDELGGQDNVAEITGRTKRLVRRSRTDQFNVDTRVPKRVNNEECSAFMNGEKRVAIISEAASVGISLHASISCKNQQRRLHIVLQLPWSAEKAVQQLGRTHRSYQTSPPKYKLLITELGGERRLASVVGMRLSALGALTSGDRRASSTAQTMSEFIISGRYGSRSIQKLTEELESTQFASISIESTPPPPRHPLTTNHHQITIVNHISPSVTPQPLIKLPAPFMQSSSGSFPAPATSKPIISINSFPNNLPPTNNHQLTSTNPFSLYHTSNSNSHSMSTSSFPFNTNNNSHLHNTPTAPTITLNVNRNQTTLSRAKLVGAIGHAAKPMDRVKRFLNRLLGLSVEDQRQIFSDFIEYYDSAIAKAQMKGNYDDGIYDIAGKIVDTIIVVPFHLC